MPKLHLKDIRFPEFTLPEMSRDDIAKAIGDARKELRDVRRDLNDFRHEMEIPRVDLSKVEMPKVEMPKLEMPNFDVPKVDVPKEAREAARKATRNVTKAAQDVGIARKPMGKGPILLTGAVILGLIGWALASSPSIRTRLRDAAQQLQDQMAKRGNAWDAEDEAEPHAFDSAVAVPVEPSAYAESVPAADSPFAEPPTDTPEGFGKTNGTHTIESDEPARA